MTRALALVTCAACFLLTLTGHIASAKPKVALTQIEGDASGDVRDAVAEALEGKDLALIGSREVNRAVDKLGDLADLTEKDFKKLASELEADAIVAGKLDKVGSAKTLKFRLFVHKKMAKGFTVSFKDAKSEKFRALLHDKMLDKIGGVSSGEDDDARPAKKKAEDDDDAALAKPDKKAKKDTKDTKLAKKPKADEDDDARPAKKAKADDDDARPAKVAKAEDDDARPARKAAAEDDDARPAKKAKADRDDAGPADDDDARPARKAAEADDAPRRTKKKVAAADDGEEIEGGVVATAEPQRGANQVAIRLDVGGSVQQRSFKFNSNIKGNLGPQNVALSPVPGARIEGELYPLAFGSPRGALAGLGFGVDYDRTLKLNLTAKDTAANMSFTVPVKQSAYSFGPRYRLAFGQTATSPTLTLGVGYGKRLFSPDVSKVTDAIALQSVRRDTPSTEYTIIDPSLSFRVPVTRMVAFSLGGSGMVITKAGLIQTGDSYGRAKVYGFEGAAAIDVVLGSHVALRLSGDFVQIGYQFLGGAKLSNGLDGDMTSKDVGGLADRAIGGAATLAVMY